MLPFVILCILLNPVTSLNLCGLSNAYKPTLLDTCETTNNRLGGYKTVSINSALGEIEAGALLIDNMDASSSRILDTMIEIQWNSGSIPIGVETALPRFITYVHTEKSPRYAGSKADWFADSLIPWPTTGVVIEANTQLSVWVNFNITSFATPGIYKGSFVFSSSNGGSISPLPFILKIFNVTIPPLATSPFRTVYAFDNNAPNSIYSQYGTYDVNATLRTYFEELAKLRFPATNIYSTAPLPMWQYELLASQGSSILILADISSLPAPSDTFTRGSTSRRYSTSSSSFSSIKDMSLLSSPKSIDCPTFSPAYISFMISYLQPTWDALGTLGLQSRATVYGFDEIDPSCEPVVRQLFAAAKSAFPGVRTLSAIDWPSVPLDLPLDVWVLMYQLVNRSITNPWVQAGHELYVYHCIEPSAEGFLNTFNERDLIQARLLFFYDFIIDVTGHLYYDTALWFSWMSVPPFWSSYTTISNVTFATGSHQPISTMPGLNDQRLSNWDPANWIWSPRTDIWANGDGVFIYPSALDENKVGGVISTIRFEAQRDGIEDWHIARAVSNRSLAKQLVNTLVSAPTVWSANLTLLEEIRLELLTLASSGQ